MKQKLSAYSAMPISLSGSVSAYTACGVTPLEPRGVLARWGCARRDSRLDHHPGRTFRPHRMAGKDFGKRKRKRERYTLNAVGFVTPPFFGMALPARTAADTALKRRCTRRR